MKLNTYQKRALVTKIYSKDKEIIYPALKLNGEAGEVAEKVGKVLRDYDGNFDDLQKKAIAYELGDVLWYIAALATDIGYSMEQIGHLNIEKLQSRKDRNKIHGEGDNR